MTEQDRLYKKILTNCNDIHYYINWLLYSNYNDTSTLRSIAKILADLSIIEHTVDILYDIEQMETNNENKASE
jgi:hypothetical protein